MSRSLSEKGTREAAAGSMLAAAQALAGLGLAVFPLVPSAKRPIAQRGFQDASVDAERIEAWWAQTPSANIGMPTGTPSGRFVLDVDGEEGATALAALVAQHGAVPAGPRVKTPRGMHHHFSDPGGQRNTAGRLGGGIDTRSTGGYVLMPPSRTANGGYEWQDADLPLPEVPEWLLDALQAPAATNGGAPRTNGGAPTNGNGGGAIAEGRRNSELAVLAGAMRRRGADADAIRVALHATNTSRCAPPLPEGEVAAIAASVSRYEPAEDAPALTDLGNAERFAARHADALRHVYERRRWLRWDNGRWREDSTGEAARAAKDTARSLLPEAAAADGDEAKRLAKHALASQAEPRLRAMLALAASDAALVVSAESLDADPYLLTCANGTLDLRNANLREHSPGDLATRGTDIAYEPRAECPRWQRFLEEIFAGDTELIAFVRRLVGYALTGDVTEHALAVLHGSGANGKTTFIETIKRLLGGFATTAAFDTFMRRREHGPRNDLARLHRARLVVASESGEGRRLDEATLKQLTGGDRIAARFLYGEYFEFTPEFKLVLVTNHRPRVDGDDDAIWRRLRLVPFEASFEGREDRGLPAKLARELPGILAWAVGGCIEWQAEGLGEAGAVTRATAEYRCDEDVLGAFLAERCQLGGEATAASLRDAYEDYCRDAGEKPLSANVLGRRLAKRGIRGVPRSGGRVYSGVSLTPTMTA